MISFLVPYGRHNIVLLPGMFYEASSEYVDTRWIPCTKIDLMLFPFVAMTFYDSASDDCIMCLLD